MTDPKNGTHYPDVPPNTLGVLDSIDRLPAMNKRAPKIRWGDEYRSWTVEKRLEFAEKLASSNNHALDLMQQERNILITTCRKQEALLKDWMKKYDEQGSLMQSQVVNANAEKQTLYQEIVTAKKEGRILALRIKELERQE